jgi:hypothetical protein
MQRASYLWAISVVLALTGSVEAQQARAPAGGAWYNGRFYQGGQFMPNSSGVGFMPSPTGMGFVDPGMGLNLPEARTTYRRAARTKARTSARGNAGEPPDQATLASTRLAMAKNLIKLGKDEQARSWLLKVSKMDASPATTSEACQLLCEIEERIGPPAPEKALDRGK